MVTRSSSLATNMLIQDKLLSQSCADLITIRFCFLPSDLLVYSDCIDGAVVIELGDVRILILHEILGTENVPRVTWEHVELAVRRFIEQLHVGFDKLDKGFSVDIFLQVVVVVLRWVFALFTSRDIQEITRRWVNQVSFLEFFLDNFILARKAYYTTIIVYYKRLR
jgi:hypothetical protein